MNEAGLRLDVLRSAEITRLPTDGRLTARATSVILTGRVRVRPDCSYALTRLPAEARETRPTTQRPAVWLIDPGDVQAHPQAFHSLYVIEAPTLDPDVIEAFMEDDELLDDALKLTSHGGNFVYSSNPQWARLTNGLLAVPVRDVIKEF